MAYDMQDLDVIPFQLKIKKKKDLISTDQCMFVYAGCTYGAE